MNTFTSPFAPAVHDETTRDFAKQILDDRRYDLCPLLADAILDAGGDEQLAAEVRAGYVFGQPYTARTGSVIRALATLTAEQVADQIAAEQARQAHERFKNSCLSRCSDVVVRGLTQRELAARITRKRPRGQSNKVELAKRLGELMERRADRNWKIACKGQRGPSVRQARELVAAIRAAVEDSQIRVRERTVGGQDVILSARAAATNGIDHRDGGRVTASNYGYRWSTSTIRSTRVADGTVEVEISRSTTESVDAPARHWQDVTLDSTVLRGGGEFAIRRLHGWDCYNAAGELVGVAVPMPRELKNRFGGLDHGRTVVEAQAEIERKRSILAAELEAKAKVEAAQAEAKRLEQRAERAARLLVRIGANVMVGYDDARAIGACDVGIRAFGAKVGVTDTAAKIPLAEIAKIEPGYAVRLARRVIQQRCTAAI